MAYRAQHWIYLQTQINSLTVWKVELKAFFFHKYQKGKGRTADGPEGDKSLFHRDSLTLSYTNPMFLFRHQHQSRPWTRCAHRVNMCFIFSRWNRAGGPEPTRGENRSTDRTIGTLEIHLDCRMRYCGSKHFCTLSHFSFFFGIVRKIILCNYKQKKLNGSHRIYIKQQMRMSIKQFSMRKVRPRMAVYWHLYV